PPPRDAPAPRTAGAPGWWGRGDRSTLGASSRRMAPVVLAGKRAELRREDYVRTEQHCGQLRRGRDLHLVEHPSTIALDGADADAEHGGDLLGSLARHQQHGDLTLARRESLCQLLDRGGRDPRLARCPIELKRLADARNEHRRPHRLLEEIDRPAFERV